MSTIKTTALEQTVKVIKAQKSASSTQDFALSNLEAAKTAYKVETQRQLDLAKKELEILQVQLEEEILKVTPSKAAVMSAELAVAQAEQALNDAFEAAKQVLVADMKNAAFNGDISPAMIRTSVRIEQRDETLAPVRSFVDELEKARRNLKYLSTSTTVDQIEIQIKAKEEKIADIEKFL